MVAVARGLQRIVGVHCVSLFEERGSLSLKTRGRLWLPGGSCGVVLVTQE